MMECIIVGVSVSSLSATHLRTGPFQSSVCSHPNSSLHPYMQDKPHSISQGTAYSNKSAHSHRHISSNHVNPSNALQHLGGHASAAEKCFLMSIPNESLTHITSFVADPSSLFALSRTNRRLRDHIADDTTWYRVFAFQFLGVGPECDTGGEKSLMLRRSQSTWRKEYIARFNLARRWERSRSATMNYQPHYWGISSMHLLDNTSLLTANLEYGIVTRSFPLTGKVLKGHLDASGSRNGFGVGNPNEEFSPNVTCISLSSSGGTARIAWAFRSGEVAVTSAPRVMDPNRSAPRYARCRVEDEHTGEVCCAVFTGKESELLVTGCTRGEVKLWDTKWMQCFWASSGKRADSLPSAGCVKVGFNIDIGVLVAALRDGDIMVWSGFKMRAEGGLVDPVSELRIPGEAFDKERTVDTFLLDANSSPSQVAMIVHHAGDRHFFRLVVDLPLGTVRRTLFGEGPLAPVTAIRACFSSQSRNLSAEISPQLMSMNGSTSPSAMALSADRIPDRSFVLAGDSLGRVCVWDLNAGPPMISNELCDEGSNHCAHNVISRVASSRRWDAHDDGAVCVIEVCDAVIVTGSERGSLKVWDSLTLDQLRSFPSPVQKPSIDGLWDPVGQVIIRKDLLIANVGSRVLVWQAGSAATDRKGKPKLVKPKFKGRAFGHSNNKGHQQIEINRHINESRRLLEDEDEDSQRAFVEERAQLYALDKLGLNEREAVEYLLMLSREEEAGKRGVIETDGKINCHKAYDDMEGVFHLDEGPNPVVVRSSSQSLTDVPSSSVANRSRSLPRAIPSNSNNKVQVSPPFLPETMEAGLSVSPLPVAGIDAGSSSSPTTSISTSSGTSSTNMWQFPAMMRSSSSSSSSQSVSSVPLAGSWSRGSPSVSANKSTARSPARSPVYAPSKGHVHGMEDQDAELKFVLELSLAEARSCGKAS